MVGPNNVDKREVEFFLLPSTVLGNTHEPRRFLQRRCSLIHTYFPLEVDLQILIWQRLRGWSENILTSN